jgi:hypothetical protein
VATIYICHPFSLNPEKNRPVIARLARRLALLDHLPLAPQIYLPQFLDEAMERGVALRMCLRIAALAQEVRGYSEPSEGMRLEIAEARRLGIPVVAGDGATEKALTGEPPR